MTIDFNTMEAQALPAFMGGEKELHAKMFFDGTNRILHGCLVPGASIGEHTHETNAEMIYILSGEGTIMDDGVKTLIYEGQCTYCPMGHSHSLINTGKENLVFFAVVPKQ